MTGGPSVTGLRVRILALSGPPVTGVPGRILALTGPPVTGVPVRILALTGPSVTGGRMARLSGLPGVGPGTVRRDATLAVTVPRHRPAGVTETARPPGGSGPDQGTEAAPEGR